jgi:hypothetical protein
MNFDGTEFHTAGEDDTGSGEDDLGFFPGAGMIGLDPLGLDPLSAVANVSSVLLQQRQQGGQGLVQPRPISPIMMPSPGFTPRQRVRTRGGRPIVIMAPDGTVVQAPAAAPPSPPKAPEAPKAPEPSKAAPEASKQEGKGFGGIIDSIKGWFSPKAAASDVAKSFATKDGPAATESTSSPAESTAAPSPGRAEQVTPIAPIIAPAQAKAGAEGYVGLTPADMRTKAKAAREEAAKLRADKMEEHAKNFDRVAAEWESAALAREAGVGASGELAVRVREGDLTYGAEKVADLTARAINFVFRPIVGMVREVHR